MKAPNSVPCWITATTKQFDSATVVGWNRMNSEEYGWRHGWAEHEVPCMLDGRLDFHLTMQGHGKVRENCGVWSRGKEQKV